MQTLEKVATFNGEENIPEEVGLGLKIDFLKNGLEKEHCGFTVLDGGINIVIHVIRPEKKKRSLGIIGNRNIKKTYLFVKDVIL